MIRMLGMMMGEKIRPVSKEEYALPIGKIAYPELFRAVPAANGEGLGGTLPKAEDFDDLMLVFAGMEQDKVMHLLDSMKQLGIPSIPLKAVITPTNQQWSSYLLRHHLMAEAEYVSSRQRKK